MVSRFIEIYKLYSSWRSIYSDLCYKYSERLVRGTSGDYSSVIYIHMYAYHTHTYTYIYLIANVSGHVRLEYVLSKIIYESKRIRKNTFIKRDIMNFFYSTVSSVFSNGCKMIGA